MSLRRVFEAAFVASAVLASLYWQVSNVVRINGLLASIEAKQRQLDSLETLVRQERAAIARLEAVDRIRRLASERLGMIEPRRPPIVVERLP
ncbi:MAG: hypothetical protein D6747_07710 [Chlorobiota bacterium]|jgi:cell division protein FtsB|nr:MAG: hypothetical protein D6747_07710 [Chlorobiota bacterium]